MAGLAAILSALGRVERRDLGKLGSIASNNFFLFCLLLSRGRAFLLVILGLLLLFPLSADPLRKIPAERLELWPLSRGQRIALRAASVWLSPAVWITVGLLIWAARPLPGLEFLAAALICHFLSLAFAALSARAPQANLLRHIPAAPGRLGGLVRKNLREMLSVLDPYAGLALSVAGLAYRVLSRAPDGEALLGVTLLIVLALSTYAQCLFGREAESGFTRYRLFPLRGWQVLAAKDAAFLVVLVVLVAPLAPLAGLAAGLVVLAIGHHQSVLKPAPQARWRFTGASIGNGLAQTVVMLSAGVTTYRTSALAVGPCLALYLVSLWYYGRALEE